MVAGHRPEFHGNGYGGRGEVICTPAVRTRVPYSTARRLVNGTKSPLVGAGTVP